jgi:hypothetical protein
MQLIARLYADVEILNRTDLDDGVELTVRVPGEKLEAFSARYAQYIATATTLQDNSQE